VPGPRGAPGRRRRGVADGGRFLADHVADGAYVEVPGRAALPWVGDPQPLIQAIERFVAEHRVA
jgi:hypothetical protein